MPTASTFYGQGRGGIEHALLCEEGWIWPGAIIAGGIRTRAPTGRSARSAPAWVHRHRRLPGLRRVLADGPGDDPRGVHGDRRPFVTGKDLILAVLAEIGVGGGTNAALEFVGEGAAALSIDERLAVATWPSRPGPRPGLFPRRRDDGGYLEGRARAAVDGGAVRPGRGVRAELRDRPRRARPLVALPHLPGQRRPGRGGGRDEDRPGLHRQLLERHDDRPAPDGGGAARAARPPRLPR